MSLTGTIAERLAAVRQVVAVLLVLAVSPIGTSAYGQGADVRLDFPEHGLKLSLGRDYKWLPVQPNEDWVVLQWLNSKLAVPSRLQMVRIDYVADSGPPLMEPDSGEAQAPQVRINSWYRYLAQELPEWHAELPVAGKEQDGFKVRKFELRNERRPGERAWVCLWEQRSKRTFALIGWASSDAYPGQLKHWRRAAERLRISERSADPRIESWKRYYARRTRFADPEYRIRVRTGLQGAWKSEDTPHFLVIYNTKDQPLISRIVRDLESLRKDFIERFPPLVELTAVSTVRICADRQEYLDYGGKDWSEGYWSAETKELVLYAGTVHGRVKLLDRAPTYMVLYHEAFHQFIHYSAGQLAPAPWFDEGFGDYFGGAHVNGGRVQRVNPNSWRLPTIQRTLRNGATVPWAELITYERDRYYGDQMAEAYAQGWSMVYFLNECAVARRHPDWSRILPKYFDELQESWDNELGVLRGDGMLEDPEALLAAQRRAQLRAMEAGFEDVDFEAIEAEWSKYILSLRVK